MLNITSSPRLNSWHRGFLKQSPTNEVDCRVKADPLLSFQISITYTVCQHSVASFSLDCAIYLVEAWLVLSACKQSGVRLYNYKTRKAYKDSSSEAISRNRKFDIFMNRMPRNKYFSSFIVKKFAR